MPPVEQGSRGISDFLEKMLASPWKETFLEYFCDYFCWGTNFGLSIFLLLVHMFQQAETSEPFRQLFRVAKILASFS